MSRGGRGGSRGRTAVGSGGKQRIGGQEVAWDYDPELIVEAKPQDIYPTIQIPQTRPPSTREKAQVEKYRLLRDRTRRGPLFTVLGRDSKVSKTQFARGARFNPFEDIESYTQKYKPPTRKLPLFNTRRYALRLFPEELHSVLDQKTASNVRRRKPKRPTTAEETDEENEEKARDDEDGEDKLRDEDDAEEGSENPEENFSDDDDEMAEDYNAEAYFDNGDDDIDDVGEDGGDDGFD